LFPSVTFNLGSSITYRIAVGPQQGRKVFTLPTLAACDEPFDDGVGKTAGFSLHVGVAAEARERKKLERLCRYISRPAVSEKRLSLMPSGNVWYQLKTPYREATTHVIFEQVDFFAQLTSVVPKPCMKPTIFRGVFAFIVFFMRHKRCRFSVCALIALTMEDRSWPVTAVAGPHHSQES